MNEQAKVSRKLRRLGMQNNYLHSLLEVTGRCNATCDYCYVKDPGARDLSLEQMRYIINKIADAGVLGVTITGGEPFIREDILTILAHLIEKDFWFIIILTNGTLITDEHIAFLGKNARYINRIQFTLFSHVPDVHDAFTGIPGSCGKILSTAKKLRDAGVPVCFTVNVLDINGSTFNETNKFLKALGYKVGNGIIKIRNAGSPISQNRDRLENCTTYDFYCRMFQVMDKEFLSSEMDRFSQATAMTPVDDVFFCTGIFTNIAIDYQGNLRPCVTFRRLTLGTVFDRRSIKEILDTSAGLRAIRALRRKDLALCSACRYVKVCALCIGLIHTETNSFKQPSVQTCHYAGAMETIINNDLTKGD
jgi:radical SAM protein with 4Fe4S-binding SPASM domain